MLEFRPEHFDALGPGVFVPDGDSLYITNGHWLMIITGCEHHIPIEILKIVANAGESFVDWRILGAREIYEEEGRYLPYRGPQTLEIYISRYSGKYGAVSAEGVRGLMEKNTEPLWGDNYRLDQLFAAGKARTKYEKQDESNERRKFSVESAAEYYMFDLDGRILTVGAEYFRCFYELGFNITCPTRSSGPPDVLGLYLRDTVPDVFGYLCPTRGGTDIRESPDGRHIFLDPTIISWFSVEDGVSCLCDAWNYEAGIHKRITESSQSANKNVLKGLSILRWYGVPEEEIEDLYHRGRDNALREQLPEMIRKTRDAIRRYKDTKDRWSEKTLADAADDLRELQHELGCELPEDLISYMGL